MADRNDSDPPYEVGYGKPPRATQFRPGQSGNGKGRPKGSKNFGKLIDEELAERISVTENGKRRKIMKKQAIAKRIDNQAVSGDLKAIVHILAETREHDDSNLVDSERSKEIDPESLKRLSDEELDKLYREAIANAYKRS